jgi:hypothetical protein
MVYQPKRDRLKEEKIYHLCVRGMVADRKEFAKNKK